MQSRRKRLAGVRWLVKKNVGRFEKKAKKDAKRKREESQELAQADKVKRQQTRMDNLANRYSPKELNIELGAAFFSAGISHKFAENQHFRRFIKKVRLAPDSYSLPNAKGMGGHVLQDVKKDLQTETDRQALQARETGFTVAVDMGKDTNKASQCMMMTNTVEAEVF